MARGSVPIGWGDGMAWARVGIHSPPSLTNFQGEPVSADVGTGGPASWPRTRISLRRRNRSRDQGRPQRGPPSGMLVEGHVVDQRPLSETAPRPDSIQAMPDLTRDDRV